MFEGLCYFNGTKWHGISYKGGGLSTHHGYEACVKKFSFSNADAVIPDTTQMLGYKPPTNYMIGNCVQMHSCTDKMKSMKKIRTNLNSYCTHCDIP